VLLNARAGTGKTFCISKLYEMCHDSHPIILTPTHKASQLFNFPLIAKTIHSYFKAVPSYLESGELEFFNRTHCARCLTLFPTEQPLKEKHILECKVISKTKSLSYQIIFVDESSMIDIDMLNQFNALEPYKLIVFICDQYQIPPINEVISPIFKLDFMETYTFKTSMRAKTDSVRIYCDKFLESITSDSKLKVHVQKVPRDAIIDSFNNHEDAICLSWTNHQKDLLNNYIRTALFVTSEEDVLQPYYVNEYLIFTGYKNIKNEIQLSIDILMKDSMKSMASITEAKGKLIPYTVAMLNKAFIGLEHLRNNEIHRGLGLGEEGEDKNVYHSSDIIIIESIEVMGLTLPYIDVYNELYNEQMGISKIKSKRRVKEEYIRFYVINGFFVIPFKDDRDKIKRLEKAFRDFIFRKNNYQKKYEWSSYYALFNILNCELDYAYSITTHKAQGSQWEKVYVNIDNLRQAGQLSSRLSYTAVSRATDSVLFI